MTNYSFLLFINYFIFGTFVEKIAVYEGSKSMKISRKNFKKKK